MDSQPTEAISPQGFICPVCRKIYRIVNASAAKRYQCKECKIPLQVFIEECESEITKASRSIQLDPLASAPTLQMPAPNVSQLPGQLRDEDSDPLELKPIDGQKPSRGDLLRVLPKSFCGYELIKELARGGMGAVLLAEQAKLRRKAAIKVMLPGAELNDPHATERFLREARAMARLRHPYMLEIYDVGEVNGMPFLGMEFVEGKTLADLIRTDKLGQRQVAEVLSKVARALAFAHARGVIHRDIKPANIMLRFSGEPVVMDFGLAKDFAAQSMKLSLTGNVMGTPAYMSPEQAQGLPVGERSDVYSLGAVLYEALTQRAPFGGNTAVATIYQVVNAQAKPVREIRKEIHEDLARICCKAMEKDPDERYPSMDELAGDLDRYLEGLAVSVQGPGLARRARSWALKHTALSSGIAVGIASLALLSIGLQAGWLRSGRSTSNERYASLTEGSAETRVLHIKALAGDLRDGRIPAGSPDAADALQALRLAVADETPDGSVAVAAIEVLVKWSDLEATDVLKAQLDSQRPTVVRREALVALSKLKPPDLGAILAAALKKDSALEVRLAAIEALSELPDPASMLQLIELAVRGEPPALAAAAKHKLTRLRKPESVLAHYAGGRGTLAAQATGEMLLKKEDYERQLEESLAEIDPKSKPAPSRPPAFESASQKLLKGDRAERLQAAFDLGVLADVRAELALVHALRDQDADVALAAAEALGRLPAVKHPERILELFRNPMPLTRRASVRACGLVRPPQAGRPLNEALSAERDGVVQAELALALGRLKFAPAAPALLALLQDGTPAAKRKSAWALGQLGDRNVRAALVEALERAGADQDLKDELAAALSALTGQSLGTDPAKWREAQRQTP